MLPKPTDANDVALPVSLVRWGESFIHNLEDHKVSIFNQIFLRVSRADDDPSSEGFPENYVLFQHSDIMSWAIFAVVLLSLIMFENTVLHRPSTKLTFARAALHSCFWICSAGAFVRYIYMTRGVQAATDWSTAYLLEWMLSVDNLFVYRSIFTIFKTPDSHKHKALFWGVLGAVIFRMVFFSVESLLFANFTWVHFILGAFLIYTGVSGIVMDGDENEEEEPHRWREFLERHLRFVDAYAPEAQFFAQVTSDASSGEAMLGDWIPQRSQAAASLKGRDARDIRFQVVATRLLLVVIFLEASDLMFAVDSVSAITSQVPNLFLAYSASAFAMCGLRATFFCGG